MPDIQKIKLDFQNLYGKSKQNPEMPEEELRTLFNKSTILENLGYGAIGKDIRLELFIKGKKSDIACIDDYGNVVFVVEFKKPSDRVELKEHFDQLWDRYVKPLRADFGALINGYELILYRRIGENNKLELRVNLSEISDKDCELIIKLLKKPDYSLTQVKDILNYLNKFSAPESRVYLTTDAAREHFFENFKLEVDSIFGELLKNTIKLFDYKYSHSKFLTSAYDFWRKSYAKKPDKVPESWKKLLKGAGLTTGEEDLYKFMFCLETTYALFTRFILAKACADYQFPGIDFSSFISTELEKQRQKGRSMGIFMASWGILAVDLINKMRRELAESVFEEDIFYWWTDDFEDLGREDPRSKDLKVWHDERKVEPAIFDYSKSIAKVLYALYKFDFSKIIGDPLGDLYQKYFDRETRKALGEFYTPKEVVEYIVDAVDYRGRGIVEKRLLDPACGSGTFLVEALKRYLNEAEPVAKESGWDYVLSKLCNEYHIVGFDIHPFATIMAQIQFMLVLIPYYKRAIELNENFVLKRLPIFRTDSLIDESKSEAMTLSMFEGGRRISIKITLPVRAGDKFVDAEVIMPFMGEAISEKTGLLNIPEYFAALQALFDTVKEAARAEQEGIEQEKLESNLKIYLQNKDWARLARFFMPYGRYFLDTIKKLKTEYGDGRLVKSIEDIILAGLLKNHVKYDFVVGNPPYVRTAKFGKEENELFRKNYWTPYGSFDIYLPFIERGIRWLKQDGKFGYITSNKYVIADYGIKLRSFILNNCEIQQIIDMSLCPDIFEEPQIYAAISIFKRKTSEIIQNTNVVTLQTNKMAMGIVLKNDKAILKEILNEINKEKVIRTDFTIQKSLQERFAKNQGNLFDIYAIGFEDIVNKIHKNTEKLIENYRIDGGFMGFEYHAAEKYISDLIPDPTKQFKKILTPSLIDQYKILWGEKVVDIFGKDFYHPYIVHDKEVRENLWSLFDSEKLVARGIARKVSVAYDDEGYALLVNVFAITKKDKRQNFVYLLGILNTVLSDFYHKVFFFLARIPEGSLRYPKPFWENFPIRLPKTPEEQALKEQITSRVEQILTKVKSEQRALHFPEEYIKEYRARGEEFDPHEIIFNANHKELSVDIQKSLDKEFVIIIKGIAPKLVDSEAKAEYLKAALSGRKVTKDEKMHVLVPRADSLAKEALAQWQKDVQEAQGIKALEDEINELVYKLYGLDENDKKVIGEFLNKF